MNKLLLAHALTIFLALCPTANAAVYYPYNGTSGVSTAGGFLGTRAPSATDDNTKGYKAKDFWNANNTQYVAISVGTNTATWQKLPPLTALMADAVPGALLCYGTFKMQAAYAGSAYKVRDSAGTTLDIGFDSNGLAQSGLADAFCALHTPCTSPTFYDQCGSALDATQATVASQPQFVTGATVGSLRALSFNGVAANYTMANATVAITTRNTFTALAIINPQTSANQSNQQALFALNSSSANWFYYGDNAVGNGQWNVSPGSGNVGTGKVLYSNPQINLTVNNSGTFTLQQNNVLSGSIVSAFSSTAATGLILGGNNILGSYQGAMAGFILYNSALSAAQQQTLLQAAYRDSGIKPQAKTTLINVASSLVCCVGIIPLHTSFITNLASAFNDPVNVAAFGYAGQTLANLTTQTAAWVNKAKVTGQVIEFITDGASNDLANSTTTTADQLYALQKSACSTAITAGSTRCAVLELFPRTGSFQNGQNSAGFESTRQSLMTLEQAGLIAGDFNDLIRGGEDPTIGTQASTSDVTLYGDAVHLTNPLGQIYETAIHVRGLGNVIQ